jgi:hypothetical protein
MEKNLLFQLIDFEQLQIRPEVFLSGHVIDAQTMSCPQSQRSPARGLNPHWQLTTGNWQLI